MSRCPQTNRRGDQCRLPLGHNQRLHVFQVLASVGPKGRRERSLLDRCRTTVKDRADGMCEAWQHHLELVVSYPDQDCPPRPHLGGELHHLWASDRDRGLHDPARCVWLCSVAHLWVDREPSEASRAGLRREAWEAA